MSTLNALGMIETKGLVAAVEAADAMVKAADVRLAAFFGPPSETNFGGGLLTGSQSACKSACDAFAEAVKFVAQNPKKI